MAEAEAPPRPTLEALLDGLPPRSAAAVDPARVAAELQRTGTTVLVVDDDPTGSQAVADVPLISAWSEDDLRWALGRGTDVAFVLTNSRALDEQAAVAVNHELGRRAQRVADELGRRLVVVSRGDSMLRGHFPAETLALDAGLRESGAAPLDAIVFCPAFPEAGRHTVEGVHWATQDDGTLRPAAETEFAVDPVFGYDESKLRAWIVARGGRRWRPDDVAAITLDDLRRGGPERVARILDGVRGGRPVACDAVDEEDLLALAAGVALAERDGRRIVARTGPSFVAARAGRRLPAPLAGVVTADAGAGTLVVVGSHTALTTRQLARARDRHRLRVLELDVAAIASSDNAATREIRQLADRAVAALAEGDVAIATGRAPLSAPTAADSVRLKARIARAVVDVTREVVVRRRPAALIAKGGITAHQIASEALGAHRAVVRGQLFPGQVSVWRLEDGEIAPGLAYVVFPGNVGGAEALADAITRTKEAR